MFEIHTSERILYKRCRRKWEFQSPNKRNVQSKTESSIHLWFGSGWHYALEDFHGYNIYGHPYKALEAYYNAFKDGQLPLPAEADEYMELGEKMADHYLDWLEKRNEFKTLWIDGVPQVEVNAVIELPELGENVTYGLTIDRVMTDQFDRVWICDYKTANQIDTNKLETDPQISSYLLFVPSIYPDLEFEGMVYMQFRKAFPKPPLQLATGGLSLNKSQATSYGAYVRALKEYYGAKIPKKYGPFLEMLKGKEDDLHGDSFIQRNFVRRSHQFLDAEYQKIIQEGREMIDPNLGIYPNPTRDCIWDCPVRSICLTMDDGGDWETILEQNYETRPEEPKWRNYLKGPENV